MMDNLVLIGLIISSVINGLIAWSHFYRKWHANKNISMLCKIFWHRMVIDGDISKSRCSRKGCNYTHEIKWPDPPPMPKCKPPRVPDTVEWL